ncbi:hypothetical protein AAG570_010454 [Ranatra chinensis]|uniref:Uncharacterized protein n=1 Tax=Ranatra chinensis TaxID=642074 RepID=A0ABD0YPR0_9HEMI
MAGSYGCCFVQAYRRAVESGDVGEALVRAAALEVAPVGPRIVGHTTRVHRVTDTEDSLKTSGVDSTGKIVTNTTTRKEHEEVREEDVPDGAGGEPTEEFVKEKSHHFTKTKDQEFVDYVADGVKIGTEMRYNAETSEGTRVGDGEWDSLSERLNKMRRGRFLKESDQDRKDALTRCPLDFDQEEKTRKAETSKWLEHHFGSESNSRSSRDSDDDNLHQTQSYINVTMKSAKDPSKGPAHTNGKVFLSSPEPTEKVYFKGISEWKSEDRKYPMGRVQVLPTGPNHTFNSSGSKSPSPPLQLPNGGSPVHHHAIHNKYPSAQNLLERRSHSSSNSPLHHSSSTERYTTKTTTTTKYFGQERNGSPYGRSSPMYSGRGTSPMPAVSSKLNNGKATPPTREHTPPRMSPPQRRRTRRTEVRAIYQRLLIPKAPRCSQAGIHVQLNNPLLDHN